MQVRSFYQGALLLILLLPGTLWAHEDLEQLRAKVASHLQEHYRDSGAARIEVQVAKLDPRLRLPACTQVHEFNLLDQNNSGGNVSVHTRCPSAPWAIYVPVQVALFNPVLVAAHNLERGTVLTETDLNLEPMNTSLLRQGYLDNLDTALGRELRRPLARGEPLRSALLDSPMAVRRGEAVILESQAGAISVTSSGTAMTNGRVGQQIRVRNSQSERIVSGEVIGPGRVRTLF